MTNKEKQELYENVCNDISCGTFILAPQYVDKLLTKLERKIASIRGSHRVDLAKLNARIEQVERLKKENAELKDELKKWKDGIALKDEEIGCIETDFNTFKSEAREIIKELLSSCFGYNSKTVNYEVKAKAEQFLKEVEE